MCGIVGMVGTSAVNQRIYDALTVLQHRGQDAAGIATSGLAGGLLTRAVAWVGIAIAALCELTMLVLAWQPLGPALPVARVAALAWLLVVAARLPTRRNVSATAT